MTITGTCLFPLFLTVIVYSRRSPTAGGVEVLSTAVLVDASKFGPQVIVTTVGSAVPGFEGSSVRMSLVRVGPLSFPWLLIWYPLIFVGSRHNPGSSIFTRKVNVTSYRFGAVIPSMSTFVAVEWSLAPSGLLTRVMEVCAGMSSVNVRS